MLSPASFNRSTERESNNMKFIYTEKILAFGTGWVLGCPFVWVVVFSCYKKVRCTANFFVDILCVITYFKLWNCCCLKNRAKHKVCLYLDKFICLQKLVILYVDINFNKLCNGFDQCLRLQFDRVIYFYQRKSN